MVGWVARLEAVTERRWFRRINTRARCFGIASNSSGRRGRQDILASQTPRTRTENGRGENGAGGRAREDTGKRVRAVVLPQKLGPLVHFFPVLLDPSRPRGEYTSGSEIDCQESIGFLQAAAMPPGDEYAECLLSLKCCEMIEKTEKKKGGRKVRSAVGYGLGIMGGGGGSDHGAVDIVDSEP